MKMTYSKEDIEQEESILLFYIFMDNNNTQAITPIIITHFFLDIFSFRIKYDPRMVIIIELEWIGCAMATCPSIRQNLKLKLDIKSKKM